MLCSVAGTTTLDRECQSRCFARTADAILSVVRETTRRSFYKIFVKCRNSKTNVLKIVLIIVNINKDQNKSLISNQFSFKNDF
jgi:hypothetical protein